MLSVAEEQLRALNPHARREVFGQELNDETYAICRSDMMLKGQDASHITVGNSFSEDGHAGRTFDYLLPNPPFGVEWKKVEDVVRAEHDKLGFAGRFGAGLPRINDGSFLFLGHMIAHRASSGGRARLTRYRAMDRVRTVRPRVLLRRGRGGHHRPSDRVAGTRRTLRRAPSGRRSSADWTPTIVPSVIAIRNGSLRRPKMPTPASGPASTSTSGRAFSIRPAVRETKSTATVEDRAPVSRT